MANIKSAIKRIRQQEKAAARNKSSRTLIKTNLKKFDAAIAENDKEKAESAYRAAAKTVDRAATKGLIHKNKAAHKKSQMARQLNSI
jgi:small subunit ribosomal protein S20